MQLVMLLWSYFNVVLNDPGVVPPNWRPANDEEGGDGAPLVGSDQSTLVSDPANQKFYTFLETTLVTLSLFKYFMAFFTEEEVIGTLGTVAASFITFVLNFAFALSVFGFMIMHLSLVASNTTTIEAYEKKATPKWQYDLGRKKNFEQVFGTDKWYWFIPAYSEEDLRRIPALQGIDYPTRPELNALQPI
ncbi:DHHC-type zinc finger family protein [Prunus dulcis]|uniref:DHHC-type zinc finger family protein n=1 Tax=Prunus dulcis TaxID=3755 RepID=A0A4Y1RHR9_PRUDU|nr:DHHC-type zinc finger family protein [Prunus dulcis]